MVKQFTQLKVQLKAQIKIQTQTVKIRKLLPKRQIKATRIPLRKKIKTVKKKKPRKRIQHKKQQRKTKRLMRYQAKQPSNQQLKSLNRVKYFFSLNCLIKAILNQPQLQAESLLHHLPMRGCADFTRCHPPHQSHA